MGRYESRIYSPSLSGTTLKVGTSSTAIESSVETNSLLASVTSIPSNLTSYYGFAIRGTVTTNVGSVGTLAGGYCDLLRVITEDTTDTSNVFGLQVRISTNIASTKTLTNTGNAGLIGLRISSYVPFGSGTYSGNYWGLQFGGESAAITGRKASIGFTGLSGGSVGNAYIADNATFTGNWFINETRGNPSLFTGTVTCAGQLIGKGTATNDNPAAGYIGEVMEAQVTSFADLTTPNDYNNVTSLSLTAGDWMISGTVTMQLNGASTPAEAYGVVLDKSGGNMTGAVLGKTTIQADASGLAGTKQLSIAVKPFRVSIASTTTWYLKARMNRSSGTPQAIGHIFAVRIR